MSFTLSPEHTTRHRKDHVAASIADLHKIGSIRSTIFKSIPNLTESYLRVKPSGTGLDTLLGDDLSSRPSPQIKSHTPFSTRFHDKVTTILKAEIKRSIMVPRKTSSETLALVPMNNIRNVLLMTCIMLFSVAPLAYMPLGIVQSAYNNKCFLHTRINLSIMDEKSNETFGGESSLEFDPLNTLWGDQFYCDFTTFAPVSIAILAVIIGWSTFTIWPAMISLGKGGVLMLVYLFISLVGLVVSTINAFMLREGYAETCNQFQSHAIEKGINITCEDLSQVNFKELVEAKTQLADDVNSGMELAQIGAWSLVTLTGFKVLISSYTFGLIWIYAHYFLFPLSYTYKTSISSMPSASE